MNTLPRSLPRTWLCLALWLLVVALLPGTAQAQSLTTLYSFSGSNGAYLYVSLMQASDGNLYGTTNNGGSNWNPPSNTGYGTVFQITPSGMLTILHFFNGSDGAYPNGLIQASDGNLYGTTTNGGSSNDGTVFKITTSGTLTTLYSFSGSDGAYPNVGLIQASDGNLYGTTYDGGPNWNPSSKNYGYGTVFKITTGGTLTTLHTFISSDGAYPWALIQASDGNLYGTTNSGGSSNEGAVFKITTSGTLTTLYSFSGGSGGAYPYAGLIQASDGNLYGTTANGGSNWNPPSNYGYGTVFKITTSGTLTTLHAFSSGSGGSYPYAVLLQASDGNLYGTTVNGGSNNDGTVFKITTGGALTTLYSFTTSNGSYPYAGLIQASDGSLYGTTYGGGASNDGTIFQISPPVTLTTLYSFSGSDGDNPYGALLQASDGNLYGTTGNGGSNWNPPSNYGYGTVFKITTSGTLTTLYSFSGPDGVGPDAGLIQGSDGNLYGTTTYGGSNWNPPSGNYGTGTIFRITTDGALTTHYSFSPLSNNTNADGAWPYRLIQTSDGNLYGTTSRGGPNTGGTVFEISTNTALLYVLHYFSISDGFSPTGLIQASDGNFYGTTTNGGASWNPTDPYSVGYGTVFKVSPLSTFSFNSLYSFGGFDGALPYPQPGGGTLLQGSDGNLYGTTEAGGAYGYGSVFKITTSGTLTTLYSFSSTIDGRNPQPSSLLQASDGYLYGTTYLGGDGNYGTIFRITTGGALTTLYSFSGSDGAYPIAGLIQASDGNLYGTTNDGGPNWNPPSNNYGYGTVFVLTLAGSHSSATLSSLSPASTPAGGPDFTLTVNGSDFASSATVQWTAGNTTPLSTTFVSASQLTATVPASLIASVGTASVTVTQNNTTSNALAFTIANPAPVLNSISPASATAGNAAFTLTANGSGFINTSAIYWNGTALATTFVSSSQLTASVPASDVATAGTASVTVVTPNPGGGTSSAQTFTINNPAPVTTSLSPASALAGGSQFTLTVNGSGFVNSSTVNWNGAALATTFVSSSQLTATVPASDIATGGTASVTVVTPSPGGGTSNAQTFTINNPAPVLSSISPTSTDAGGPGFTLTVKGSSFLNSSTVNWNGSPLTTTFVSATQLKAFVPTSLIANPGKVKVTIITPTPGGGASTAKTFTVLLTTLKLVSATLTKDSTTGVYTANLTLTNVGYNTAPNVTVTKATLGAATTSTSLPVSVGSMAAGSSGNTALTFPASAGASGTVVSLKVSGKFTGGTFSGSLKVKLP